MKENPVVQFLLELARNPGAIEVEDRHRFGQADVARPGLGVRMQRKAGPLERLLC